MKKLILSALVVGSLLATSCKDGKEAGSELTDTLTEAGSTIEGGADAALGLEGITIPDFEDPKAKEYLVEYSAYAKEYIAVGADASENSDLMAKGTALATKSAEVLKGMDAESAQKFSAVLKAIASKMVPATE